jgi:hypothetical protein
MCGKHVVPPGSLFVIHVSVLSHFTSWFDLHESAASADNEAVDRRHAEDEATKRNMRYRRSDKSVKLNLSKLNSFFTSCTSGGNTSGVTLCVPSERLGPFPFPVLSA